MPITIEGTDYIAAIAGVEQQITSAGVNIHTPGPAPTPPTGDEVWAAVQADSDVIGAARWTTNSDAFAWDNNGRYYFFNRRSNGTLAEGSGPEWYSPAGEHNYEFGRREMRIHQFPDADIYNFRITDSGPGDLGGTGSGSWVTTAPEGNSFYVIAPDREEYICYRAKPPDLYYNSTWQYGPNLLATALASRSKLYSYKLGDTFVDNVDAQAALPSGSDNDLIAFFQGLAGGQDIIIVASNTHAYKPYR